MLQRWVALQALHKKKATLIRAHLTTLTPQLPPTARLESANKIYVPLFSLPVKHTENCIQPANDHVSSPDSKVTQQPCGATNLFVMLASEVFGHPIRRDIVHLCLTHYMDGRRQGSANTKTRYEVRGSRRKLYAQKGMGKARVGDAASPTRRGGGVAFGPKPRDFSSRLPRKIQYMGMRIAWSAKVREGRLMAIESFEWPGSKTRGLAQRLDQLGWRDSRTLFITGENEFLGNFRQCCGNLEGTEAKVAVDVTIHDALKYSRVVMDVAALGYFEERLRKGSIMPVADSRKKVTTSRRDERRIAAIEKANQLTLQIVRLQYERRFGQPLPPIPRRLTSELDATT